MDGSTKCSHIGLFLAVLNSVSDSTYLAMTNILPVIPEFVLLARSLTHILISVLILLKLWNHVIASGVKKSSKLLLLRASINGITITLKAVCVQYMPVSDLSIISQTTPVFVCIIAVIFLNERITLIDTFIIIFCFVGVFLVLQPDFVFHSLDEISTNESQDAGYRKSYFIAAVFMIFGSFVNASTTVMLKKLSNNVHFAVIMLSSGFSTLAYGALGFSVMVHTGQILPSRDLCTGTQVTSLMVLVAGCLGYMAQFTNINVLKHIRASVKSVLCNTMNVFLAFVYTILLTPDQANLNFWKIMGSILVLISGFLLYVKKEGNFFNRLPNITLSKLEKCDDSITKLLEAEDTSDEMHLR